MPDQGPREIVIPDFVKGACFMATLAIVTAIFALQEPPKQHQNDRSSNGQIIRQSSVAGAPKQKRQANRGHYTEEQESSLYAVRDWLIDIKLSDALLVLFTAILAWKTWGLDESTRLLWKAGEHQRQLSEKSIADQSITTAEALRVATISAQAATKSVDSFILFNRPWISCFVDIIGDLVFNDRDCGIGISITLVNESASPALNTFVMPGLAKAKFNERGEIMMGGAIRKAIAASQNSKIPKGFGFVVPPHSKYVDRQIVSVDISDIRDDSGEAIILIAGVVSYDFPLGSGQTTFSFTLKENSSQTLDIKCASNRRVAANELSLIPERLPGHSQVF